MAKTNKKIFLTLIILAVVIYLGGSEGLASADLKITNLDLRQINEDFKPSYYKLEIYGENFPQDGEARLEVKLEGDKLEATNKKDGYLSFKLETGAESFSLEFKEDGNISKTITVDFSEQVASKITSISPGKLTVGKDLLISGENLDKLVGENLDKSLEARFIYGEELSEPTLENLSLNEKGQIKTTISQRKQEKDWGLALIKKGQINDLGNASIRFIREYRKTIEVYDSLNITDFGQMNIDGGSKKERIEILSGDNLSNISVFFLKNPEDGFELSKKAKKIDYKSNHQDNKNLLVIQPAEGLETAGEYHLVYTNEIAEDLNEITKMEKTNLSYSLKKDLAGLEDLELDRETMEIQGGENVLTGENLFKVADRIEVDGDTSKLISELGDRISLDYGVREFEEKKYRIKREIQLKVKGRPLKILALEDDKLKFKIDKASEEELKNPDIDIDVFVKTSMKTIIEEAETPEEPEEPERLGEVEIPGEPEELEKEKEKLIQYSDSGRVSFSYIVSYEPKIKEVIPKNISVDSEGSLSPEIYEFILKGEDFALYKYLGLDENGKAQVKYKYPIIEIGRSPGNIVLDKNKDPNLEIYLYRDNKLVTGEAGNRLGNKISFKVPESLKIDPEKIGENKQETIKIINPDFTNEEMTGSGKEGEKDIIFINYEDEPEKIPVIHSLDKNVALTKEVVELIIQGENFSPKEDIKVFYDGLELEKKDYKIEDDGRKISLRLEPKEEEGRYYILVENNKGAYDQTYIELVDKYVGSEDFTGLTIVEKPRDYGDNNLFLVGDFNKSLGDLVLSLDSKTTVSEDFFEKKIKSFKLRNLENGEEIEVGKGFTNGDKNQETISLVGGRVFLRLDDRAREFLYSEEDDSCQNKKTKAGRYEIIVVLTQGEIRPPIKIKSDKGDKEYSYINIKEKPRIISSYPAQGERYLNPNNMGKTFKYEIIEDGKKIEKEESGNYLRIQFKDLGNLSLRTTSPSGITLYEKGDMDNKVANSKRLFLEGDTLYIPLKDKLEDGKTYLGHLPANKYVEYGDFNRGDLGIDSRNNDFKNNCYSWEFTTNTIPLVMASFDGSVVEDYDLDYPIILEGEGFNSRTEVEFKSSEGKYYSADKVRRIYLDNDIVRLEVYLPRRRLKPDSYTIVTNNSRDHEAETEHGILSVVEAGKYFPNSDYWVKDNEEFGRVEASRYESKDSLRLDRSSENASYLSLDLDEIMGRDGWFREIDYSSRAGTISRLELKSQLADIVLSNLVKRSAPNDSYKIQVGRASANLEGVIRSQVRKGRIVSNLIQVKGKNFEIGNINIKIPYKGLEGNMSVYRYDLNTRSLEKLNSSLNSVEKTVEANSTREGIFFIIEVI